MTGSRRFTASCSTLTGPLIRCLLRLVRLRSVPSQVPGDVPGSFPGFTGLLPVRFNRI